MKRVGCMLAFAMMLSMLLMVSMSWFGLSIVHAQDTDPQTKTADVTLPLNVTMETEDGEILTLPLQAGDKAFATLFSLDPAVDIIGAYSALSAQNVQTITVVAPYVITPVSVSLVINPINAPSPPIADEDRPVAVADESEDESEDVAEDMSDAANDSDSAEESADSELPVTPPPLVIKVNATLSSNANLRLMPTLDSDILGQLAEGTSITVIGRNSDGAWLYLDDASWVAGSLVEDAPDDLPIVIEGADLIAETVPATVAGGTVILRAGPSTSDGSLGLYEEGTICAIINRTPNGEWVEVVTPDGRIGWMSIDFLDVTKSLDDVPAVISSDTSAIRGMVVDDQGEGIDDINVVALHTGDGNIPSMDATTSSNGVFIFYTKPGDEKEWTVRITGVGCNSRIVNDRCQLFSYFALSPEASVTLPSDDIVSLVFETATSFIAGTVVDNNGEPVGDGYLVSGIREDGATTAGETSSTGKFVLPAASGLWTVSTNGGGTLLVEVPEDSAPEPIELSYQ